MSEVHGRLVKIKSGKEGTAPRYTTLGECT